MFSKKINLWFALLLLVVNLGKAQNNNAIGASVAPSPNAAAANRYGETPVNLHSGTVSVGVSIYTIGNTGGLSALVSLGLSNMNMALTS